MATALNEKGIPTPLVVCVMRAPESRMDILSKEEIGGLINQSSLAKKYNQTIDRESAHEMLTAKLEKLSHQTGQLPQSTSNGSKQSTFKVSKSSDNTKG